MAFNPWTTLGYVTGDKRHSQVYVSDPQKWEKFYEHRHHSGRGIKDTEDKVIHNRKDHVNVAIEERIREQHGRKIKEGLPRVTDCENMKH